MTHRYNFCQPVWPCPAIPSITNPAAPGALEFRAYKPNRNMHKILYLRCVVLRKTGILITLGCDVLDIKGKWMCTHGMSEDCVDSNVVVAIVKHCIIA